MSTRADERPARIPFGRSLSNSRFSSAVPGHEHKGGKKSQHDVAGISPPGATGVIYVTDRATANGFKPGGDGVSPFAPFQTRRTFQLTPRLPIPFVSVGQLCESIPLWKCQPRLTLGFQQGQGAPESKSILILENRASAAAHAPHTSQPATCQEPPLVPTTSHSQSCLRSRVKT